MFQQSLFEQKISEQHKPWRFIDLFAGIGGFHLGLHSVGAKCVFACEIDKFARETYMANFSHISPTLFDNNLFSNDITNVNIKEIPDFEILCAGFPCQPFSQAGLKLGFEDSNRGNMFLYILKIIEAKKPESFILENVQHLIKHNNGETFNIIKESLINLGYSFYYKVLKASDFGLPQYRPRVYMVGFLNDNLMMFEFPEKIKLQTTMSDIFNGKCNRDIGFTLRVGGKGSGVTDRRNWDCYLVNGIEIKINVEQAKALQGFPAEYVFPVSKTQAMKQLGNSVAINVVSHLANNVIQYLELKQASERKQV